MGVFDDVYVVGVYKRSAAKLPASPVVLTPSVAPALKKSRLYAVAEPLTPKPPLLLAMAQVLAWPPREQYKLVRRV